MGEKHIQTHGLVQGTTFQFPHMWETLSQGSPIQSQSDFNSRTHGKRHSNTFMLQLLSFNSRICEKPEHSGDFVSEDSFNSRTYGKYNKGDSTYQTSYFNSRKHGKHSSVRSSHVREAFQFPHMRETYVQRRRQSFVLISIPA